MPRYLVQSPGPEPSAERRLDECETIEESFDSAIDFSETLPGIIQIWDAHRGCVVAHFLNGGEIR